MSGKKYVDAVKKIDQDQFYGPSDAIRLAKATATAASTAFPPCSRTSIPTLVANAS